MLALKNKDRTVNVMDTIWDRKIIRSRRSLGIVAGLKQPNDQAEPTKVER